MYNHPIGSIFPTYIPLIYCQLYHLSHLLREPETAIDTGDAHKALMVKKYVDKCVFPFEIMKICIHI